MVAFEGACRGQIGLRSETSGVLATTQIQRTKYSVVVPIKVAKLYRPIILPPRYFMQLPEPDDGSFIC